MRVVICRGARIPHGLFLALVGAALVLLALTACRPKPSGALPDAGAAQASTLSATELLARVETRLRLLRSYRAVLEHEIRPAALIGNLAPLGAQGDAVLRAHTRVWAAPPGRMAIETRTRLDSSTTPGGHAPSFRLFFDGETVWGERRLESQALASPTVEHFRLDQRRLAAGRAPLDVGYQFWGHGLLPGKDLVGTIRTLLRRYSFEPRTGSVNIRGEDCFELTGRATPGQLLDEMIADRDPTLGGYLLARSAGDKLPPAVLETMTDMIVTPLRARALLRLYVSDRQGTVRGWAFGEGAPAAAELLLQSFDPEAAFQPAAFKPRPEMIADARDLSDKVEAERARIERAFEDAAAVRAARAALLQALERPTTPPPAAP